MASSSTNRDASSPSAARLSPVSSSELPAAWAFSGSPRPRERKLSTLALAAAILLHASLALIEGDYPAPQRTETALSFDMLVPIETEAHTPEPEPRIAPSSQAEPIATAPSAGSGRAAPQDLGTRGQEPNADPSPGPASDELAAPTLSQEGGATPWALLGGHGASLDSGRLARGSGLEGGGISRTTSLKARDLSRAATAPALQPWVDRNFPVAAKMARVDGTVTVSAMIQANGTPTDVRVLRVNPRGRGFGETCTRTILQGPRWKPALNRDGRPFASLVEYTCHFNLPDDLAISTDAPTSGAGANRVWTKPAGG